MLCVKIKVPLMIWKYLKFDTLGKAYRVRQYFYHRWTSVTAFYRMLFKSWEKPSILFDYIPKKPLRRCNRFSQFSFLEFSSRKHENVFLTSFFENAIKLSCWFTESILTLCYKKICRVKPALWIPNDFVNQVHSEYAFWLVSLLKFGFVADVRYFLVHQHTSSWTLKS